MSFDATLLRLNGGGCEQRRHGYFFDARLRTERPHVVLQLTLAGCGFYEHDDGRHILPVGHAFFAELPGPFNYGIEGDRYDLVFISLAGAVAWQMLRHVRATFGSTFAINDAQSLGGDLRQFLERRGDDGRAASYETSAELYGLLMRAFAGAAAARMASGGSDPLVNDATGLVSIHAGDRDFTVAGLAAMLGVSREHLTRTLVRRTGQSPADAIVQARLRLAASHLRNGDDKLQVVARQSGFAGANYLCRIFRKHVGVTPAEFRKRPWLAGP